MTTESHHLDVHGLVKPLLRGRLHLGAFVVAVPAAIVLVALGASAGARWSATVYGATLLVLFGTSAAYHRLGRTLRSQRVLRRLDHAAIYLLIAGSYTPVSVVAIGGWRGWTIVAVVWVAAGVGVALKLGWFDAARVVGATLYLVLGWLAVIALPALVPEVSPAVLVLLVTGGVAYTLGALVLARRQPDPLPRVFGYHEVWHSLVIVAAACHYAAMVLIVRAG
jgi:hemolysin III